MKFSGKYRRDRNKELGQMHLSVSTWTGNRRIGRSSAMILGDREWGMDIDGEDIEEDAFSRLVDKVFRKLPDGLYVSIFNIVTHLHRMYFN